MAYPRAFLRLVASGTVLGGKDIWSCSWSLDVDFLATARDDQITGMVLPQTTAALSAWFGRNTSGIAATTSLDLVKANMIGPDGHYLSDSVTYYQEIEEPVRGAVSSGFLPPQSSVAVSLLTNAKRGLASRGRFFPPSPSFSIDPQTGVLSPTQTAGVAASAKTLLDAFNAMDGCRVVVASNTREGAMRNVQSVAVGSVIDTIRSRRNALEEVYERAELSPT